MLHRSKKEKHFAYGQTHFSSFIFFFIFLAITSKLFYYICEIKS